MKCEQTNCTHLEDLRRRIANQLCPGAWWEEVGHYDAQRAKYLADADVFVKIVRQVLDLDCGEASDASEPVPVREVIFTARHWLPALEQAHFAKDWPAMEILRVHGIHSNHCGGYETLAWPCPTAATVLERLLCRECARQRPCPIHDWHIDCCPCGYSPNAHCQAEHLPAGMECAACGRTAEWLATVHGGAIRNSGDS